MAEELKEKLGIETDNVGFKEFMSQLELVSDKLRQLGNMQDMLFVSPKNIIALKEASIILNKISDIKKKINPSLLSSDDKEKFSNALTSFRDISTLNEDSVNALREQEKVMRILVGKTEEQAKKQQEITKNSEKQKKRTKETARDISDIAETAGKLEKSVESAVREFKEFRFDKPNKELQEMQDTLGSLDFGEMSSAELKKIIKDIEKITNIKISGAKSEIKANKLIFEQLNNYKRMNKEAQTRKKIQSLYEDALKRTAKYNKQEKLDARDTYKILKQKLQAEGVNAKEAKSIAMDLLDLKEEYTVKQKREMAANEKNEKLLKNSSEHLDVLQKRASKLAVTLGTFEMQKLHHDLERTKKTFDSMDMELLKPEETEKLSKAIKYINTINDLEKTDKKILKEQMNIIKDINKEIEKREKIEDLMTDAMSMSKSARQEEIKQTKEIVKELEKKLRLQGKGKMEAKYLATKAVAEERFDKMGKGAQLLVGAFKQLGAVFMTFLGPIAALLSLAAFADAMLEADKRIKDAQKDMMKLGASTSFAAKSMGEMGVGNYLKDIEKMRSSQRRLWADWGIGYEEAQQDVEALSHAGFKLDQIMGDVTQTAGYLGSGIAKSNKYSLELVGTMETMSLMSGKSFGEIADMAGRLKKEMGVSVKDLDISFSKLIDDANESGMATSAFFERVLNASSGLIIYGQKVSDVSSLFKDLTKSMNLPIEKAAELAEQSITHTKNMSLGQKAFISDMGNGEKVFQRKFAETTAALAKAKKEGDITKIADISKTLEKYKIISEIQKGTERSARILQEIDVAGNMEIRMRSMVNTLPNLFHGVDIGDTKALAKVLNGTKETVAELIKGSGESEETVRMVAEQLQFMSNKIDMFGEVSKSVGFNMESLRDVMRSQDPKMIAEKSAELGKKIGVSASEIEDAIKSQDPKTFAEIISKSKIIDVEGLKKSIALTNGLTKDQVGELQKLTKQEDVLNFMFKELKDSQLKLTEAGVKATDLELKAAAEKKKSDAKILKDATKSAKDALEQAGGGAIDGMYITLRSIFKWLTKGTQEEEKIAASEATRKEGLKIAENISNLEYDLAVATVAKDEESIKRINEQLALEYRKQNAIKKTGKLQAEVDTSALGNIKRFGNYVFSLASDIDKANKATSEYGDILREEAAIKKGMSEKEIKRLEKLDEDYAELSRRRGSGSDRLKEEDKSSEYFTLKLKEMGASITDKGEVSLEGVSQDMQKQAADYLKMLQGSQEREKAPSIVGKITEGVKGFVKDFLKPGPTFDEQQAIAESTLQKKISERALEKDAGRIKILDNEVQVQKEILEMIKESKQTAKETTEMWSSVIKSLESMPLIGALIKSYKKFFKNDEKEKIVEKPPEKKSELTEAEISTIVNFKITKDKKKLEGYRTSYEGVLENKNATKKQKEEAKLWLETIKKQEDENKLVEKPKDKTGSKVEPVKPAVTPTVQKITISDKTDQKTLKTLTSPKSTTSDEEGNVVNDYKTVNINIIGGDPKMVEKLVRQVVFEEHL